jgi:signal transduction histidine kinase
LTTAGEHSEAASSSGGEGGLHAAIAACAERFAESRDLHGILRDAVTLIREYIGLDRAGIFLFDEESREWHGVFGTDTDGSLRDERWIEIPRDPRHPFSRAAAGECYECFIEDFGATFPDDPFMKDVKNFCFVSLRAHNHLLGGISVDNLLTGRPIETDKREQLSRFARYVALAIENLQLLERTEAQNRQLTEELERRKKAEREREAVLEQLRRANEDLSDFAHVVSHDLKSPLHTINGMIDWLLEDYGDQLDEEGHEKLAIVQRRTHRMGDLIQGILQYSRMGRMELKLEEVDVPAVISEVAEIVGPPDGIRIRTEGTLPAVVYDPTQLHQVFQNLIGNAVKYMGSDEGTVTVSSRMHDGLVEFCVADTGRGIAEKDREKVFKMLQSLRSEKDEKSSGIGLAVVKKIVERNGGSIRLESEPGEGSRFYFTVPVNRKASNNDGE